MSAPTGITGTAPAETFLAGLADGDERARWEADLALADAFISRFGWCAGIAERHVGAGIGPVSVVLLRIVPEGDAGEWHWIVVGDASPLVMDADRADAPACAALVYCAEVARWVAAVRAGDPLDDVWPLLAADGRRLLEPTPEAADLVEERITRVREAVVADHAHPVAAHCPGLAENPGRQRDPGDAPIGA